MEFWLLALLPLLLLGDLFGGSGDDDDGDSSGGGGDATPPPGQEPVPELPPIRGTDGDDVVNGTPEDDLIRGFAGNDVITGGEGDDTAKGGDGEDTISGGPGDDGISGQDGADSLNGDGGADTLLGGFGNDTMDGGDAADSIDGGSGNDSGAGGAGDDTLLGGDGFDSLDGNAGNDLLRGGRFADVLNGGAGLDSLFGEAGDDTLLGGDDADLLDGGKGSDQMDGGAGNDRINGYFDGTDAPSERASDLEDADTLIGGVGADILTLGSGDTATGGDDNDTFRTGTWISGTSPVITDYAAGDNLEVNVPTGTEADWTVTVQFDNADAVVLLSRSLPEGGTERINVAVLEGARGSFTESDVNIVEFTPFEEPPVIDQELIGTDAAERIDARDGAGTDPGTGTDTLIGNGGDDTLLSREGNDLIDGGLGADVMRGGYGDDRLEGYEDGSDNGLFAAQDLLDPDTMAGGPGEDIFLLGSGDVATGQGDADTFITGTWVNGTTPVVTDFAPVDNLEITVPAGTEGDWSIQVQYDNTTAVVSVFRGADDTFERYEVIRLDDARSFFDANAVAIVPGDFEAPATTV